ncbi:group 1 glycosyl transferase, partial [Streptomyces sp. adm13(2018)]
MSRVPSASAATGGAPAGVPDPFVAARAGAGRPAVDGPSAWRGPEPNLLAELVRAEYGPRGAGDGRPAVAIPADLVLARFRQRVRAGRTPSPEECVRLLGGCDDHSAAAVFDVWPDVVLRHGPARAARALRGGLRAASDPRATAPALDLAAATGLRPLRPSELLPLCAAEDRVIRHAALRLLTADGTPLPARGVTGDPGDAYERLLHETLRDGPPRLAGSVGLRPGMFVAQSMLLGDLDRPGEGSSGGLGVLLGSLGDALARTDRVGGVLTVVTACVPDLEVDPVLLRRRDSGHWVLRIPVDSPHPLRAEEAGRHREAMAWWATRLLTSIGRPIDVLHVRYADDGSLALAEA